MYKYDGKHIQVSCAIIESNGLVLAAQRSREMAMPFKWEFPGGKIKLGEDAEGCLERELMEEMGLRIAIKGSLRLSTHEYPTFTITLHPFVCEITGGAMVLHDHQAVLWLPPSELFTLDWAAADLPVIEAYRQSLASILSKKRSF